MHPNMRKLLGLDGVKVVFHEPTWPTPVDVPYTEETTQPRKQK